jgi:hypothetical protein
MDKKFNKKWKPTDNTEACIETEDGEDLCFIMQHKDISKVDLRNRILCDHNACLGLAQLESMPELIEKIKWLSDQWYEGTTDEIISETFGEIGKLIAQIEGVDNGKQNM